MKVILLDIEGTTTPVNFVYGTLFPFAKANIKAFVESEHVNVGLEADIKKLWSEYEQEPDKAIVPTWNFGESPLQYLNWLMEQDRKSTALKSIQGKIWEEGYRNGTLKGQVFSDVPSAFQKWKDDGIEIYIYSSGSVLAQKLLFKNSIYGDLSKNISDYFDTEIGSKQESNSYKKIAEFIHSEPEEILFISDSLAELVAAQKVGIKVMYSIRPGNLELGNLGSDSTDLKSTGFKQVKSFLELFL